MLLEFLAFTTGTVVIGTIGFRNILWAEKRELARTSEIAERGIAHSLREAASFSLLLSASAVYASQMIEPNILWLTLGIFLLVLATITILVSFSKSIPTGSAMHLPEAETPTVQRRVLIRRTSSLPFFCLLIWWLLGWYEYYF